MPNFLVELTDGRKFQVEADTPPTEADLQQYMGQSEAPKEEPMIDVSDTLKAAGQAIGGIATTAPHAFRQLYSGLENPWQRSEGYKTSQAAMDQFQQQQEAANQAAVESGDISTSSRGMRQAGQSLGFSAGAMGAGLVGSSATGLAGRGIGTAIAGPAGAATGEVIGRGVGALGAGYGAAYRMAGAQFLDDASKEIDAKFMEKLGRLPNEQEQKEAYDELLPLAQAFGHAEAGPEAIGNLAMAKAGKFILGLGINKVKGLAAGALAKVGAGAGGLATELGGETITQVEQNRLEEQKNALLSGQAPPEQGGRTVEEYQKALGEVAPATLATMGLIGSVPTAYKAGELAVKAYKQPANAAAAELLHAASVSSNDTELTNKATEEQIQDSVDATVVNGLGEDLSRYQPPDPQVANDFEEQLRANEDENLFGLGLEAEQDKLRQQQAYAEAQQRQAQFEGLSQNEQPITPATGNPIPTNGEGQDAAIQPEQQLPDGLGVFEAPQLATNEPPPPESLASESEGVLRNRAQIANAAALNSGQIAPTPIPSVFPQVQPAVVEQPVERKYTVANVKTGKVVSRPDEPMTHKEAITFRSKFSQPNNFTLVDVTNEQVTAPNVEPVNAENNRAIKRFSDDLEMSGFAKLDGSDFKIKSGGDGTFYVERTTNGNRESISIGHPDIESARNAAIQFVSNPQSSNAESVAPNQPNEDVGQERGKGDKAGNESSGQPVENTGMSLEEAKKYLNRPGQILGFDEKSFLNSQRKTGNISPAAQKEPPLTPSGQVANEGGGPVTSNETEAGFQVQPPVATKETPDEEVSSGKGVSLFSQKEEVKPLPKEIKAIHFSRSPLSLSEKENGSSVGEGADSVFGFGLYAMEPQDQKGWESMDRLVLGKNRNELTINAKNPLIVSPETVVELMQRASKDGVTFNNPWGFHSWLREQAENGKNDVVIVRGFDLSGDKSKAINDKIRDRINELWKPVFLKGKTDGKFTNGDELNAAIEKATNEITGLNPQELEIASSMQNQIFIPPNKVGIVASEAGETTSADIESKALEILLQKRPNLSATVREKAKKYFTSRNSDDLSGISTGLKTAINHSLQEADPQELYAQLAKDKAEAARMQKMEEDDRKADEEMANRQAELSSKRSTAYDSIVGTPTGVEMNAVSEADGQEALAAVNNSGDVPGVLNAFVGTSGQFLANPENEANFHDLWKILSAGRVDEGNFAYGRAFVFTDGIGVNASDRRNAERLGVTPSVAAVRRVLIHEGLVHRGIYGLPAGLQMQILQWVRQNTTPEQLDNLARDYPQYENWRNNPQQMLGLCEEYLAKTVEKITKFPKDGPLAKLFDILRNIWRWITGETGEPTVQNLRDIVKLLKAGVEAADARLVNGGKVDIKESRPSFANPINAELARAAERFRQMQERQPVETVEGLKELFNPNAQGSGTTNKLFEQVVTPQQIRSEIRAAYDRAIVGSGSVQTSLQSVYDEAKTQIPTLTEKQFGEQLQALYEDGGAFLVPADRSDTMLAAGEKWGVYDASGMPASYVGILTSEVKASRIETSEVPKAIAATKGFPEAIDAIQTASPTLVESQARALKDHLPDDHIQQGVEPRVAVSIALIDRLLKSGIPAIELPSILNSPAFLESLGIEQNADMQQYLSIEALSRINQAAVDTDSVSERNALARQADGAAKTWNLLGEYSGRSLGTRGWLMKHPRYAAMFVEQGILSNLANQSEDVTRANVADPNAVVKGVEKASETAKDEAAKQTEEDLVAGWMEAAEETLSPKAKSLFDRIREKLARIGYLMGLNTDTKQSVSANLAARFAQEYKGITKDSIQKEIAKLRKEVEEDLSAVADEILGKDAPQEVKTKVKKSVEKAAGKAKRKKLTAEEKAKKKEERANAVAQRLIYRTEEVFRQGFKNESKSINADSILKAFRDQVKQPVSEEAFTARVKKLNVSETVAARMLKTAARERGDQEQIRKNTLLDSTEALKKIIYKLSGKLGIFQIDPTSWRKLFSTSNASQEQRKVEMQEAIKADPTFSNLDTDEQQQLADLLDEAWQVKHDEVLKTEINRLTRANKMSDKAKDAINEAIPEIIQMVNRGTFDNAELASIVAKKFGLRDLTTEERVRLREITERLQQDITPWEHKKLANELRELLADVTKLNFAELAEAWWVSSVLSGPRTAFTIGLGFLSGGFEVIKNSLGTVLLHPNDPKAWDASFKAIKGWLSSMPREAQRALAYLKTGDVTLLDSTMSNDAALIDRAVKELGSVGIAAKLLKSKNPIARKAGQFMGFMQKLLTALDMFNGYTAKYAALPLAYYQTQSVYDPKELDTISNHKLARQQVLTSEFGGNEPTTLEDKARLNAWATDKMWKDIQRLGTLEENANYLAQQANMTLDPTGVGGIFYHTVLGIQAKHKKASADFVQKQKEELLNKDGLEKEIAKFNLALGYVYQFAAHNFLGALGLKFSRFAGSKINQTLSFIPLIGLTRLAEKTDAQKMHIVSLAGAQSIGFLLLGQAIWILSQIADEPDDEKRGWDIQGNWNNLTPERKQQLLAAGKREYTIFYKGHRYSYANWPISGMLAAIGSMADLIRYSPDQWNEKSVANRLASGVWAAAASVGDSAALSQLSELLGTSMASRDPIEASMGKFNRVFGNYAGGFVPRILKDVDLMQNPKINTYKTLWERLAKETPIYRRFEGKPLLDIFGNQVAPSRLPWSRELVLQPPEPEYQKLGQWNDNGIWLNAANPQNRMVGKGRHRRPMTEMEADRYVDIVGKGYRDLVLKYGDKVLSMPKERAKAFVSDKADDIRNIAAKKSVKTLTSS